MNKSGFTLVEVMIFIAISGMLFIFGLKNLIDTQQKDQFNVALGNIKSQLQVYFNDSENGNYQLPQGFYCFSSLPRLTIASAARPPVSDNPNCSYLGSALYFVNNPSTNLSKILIFPVFGYTFKDNTVGFNQSAPNSTSLSESLPVSSPSLYTTYNLPASVSISKVTFVDNNNQTNNINLFLLLSNFNQYTSSNSLNSGSQFSRIIPIIPFATPIDYASQIGVEPVSYINQLTDQCTENNSQPLPSYACRENNNVEITSSAVPISPPSGISICLNSTNGSESAQLIIGNSTKSSNSTIFTKLYNGINCL